MERKREREWRERETLKGEKERNRMERKREREWREREK